MNRHTHRCIIFTGTRRWLSKSLWMKDSLKNYGRRETITISNRAYSSNSILITYIIKQKRCTINEGEFPNKLSALDKTNNTPGKRTENTFCCPQPSSESEPFAQNIRDQWWLKANLFNKFERPDSRHILTDSRKCFVPRVYAPCGCLCTPSFTTRVRRGFPGKRKWELVYSLEPNQTAIPPFMCH